MPYTEECTRFFKSDECVNRHKDDSGPAESLCHTFVACKKCQRVVIAIINLVIGQMFYASKACETRETEMLPSACKDEENI